jgi:hypothetical protein
MHACMLRSIAPSRCRPEDAAQHAVTSAFRHQDGGIDDWLPHPPAAASLTAVVVMEAGRVAGQE